MKALIRLIRPVQEDTLKYSTPITSGATGTALLERPGPLTIVSADDDCDTCFGRGQIFAKPGELVPCPACCGGFTAVAPVLVDLAPLMGIGCLDCMHDCGGLGCGCTCCCSYLPAVSASIRGEA